MVLVGTVEDVVYRNVENGYAVVRTFTTDGPVVVTGKFPLLGEGETIEVEGEFKVNPKFGEQFEAKTIKIYKPTTEEEITNYLASGLISGVGPVTASSIVQKFKTDTFDIIENYPARLSEIRGVSLKKAIEIHKTFNDIKKMQNAVMFLQKYDISINMSVKIYEIYKEKTEFIIATNPYKLVEDIEGIGFRTADKIAIKVGVESESPFRIRAGILFVLSEVVNKYGSTLCNREDVFKQTATILEQDYEKIEDKIDIEITKLIIDGRIKDIERDDIKYLTLTKYYDMEKVIASKIIKLQYTECNFRRDISEDISLYEKKNKITLADGQKAAIEKAINEPVVIITGGPGTGKTTIIKNVIQILNSWGNKCMLLAPTGRAAKRLEEATKEPASTIHRALDLKFGNKPDRCFTFSEDNPLNADVVIVDEASMLDCYVCSNLLKAIKLGSRLILVGDKDQLPSVGAGNVLGDLIASNIVTVVELTQIYRQAKESRIITCAHQINNCEMPDITVKDGDFFFMQSMSQDESLKEIVNLVQNRLPKFLNVDSEKIQIIAPMKAGICGVNNINIKLQEVLNAPSISKGEIEFQKKIFRVGDKVMQITNNYDQEWSRNNGQEIGQGVFNGDMGKIIELNPLTSEIVVEFEDGRTANYSLAELDEITHSYAITVHKSQGSEFDAVIIPVFGGNPVLYNKNLLYTAVTRAKKLVVLIGNPKSVYAMVKNRMVSKRDTNLKQLLIEQNKMFE